MSKYTESQRRRAIGLIAENPNIFDGAKGGGKFIGKPRDFVLKVPINNLYPKTRKSVEEYFKENHISHWGGHAITGHTLSSQVACLNHLFAIKDDPEAVTGLLKGISKDFVGPVKITSDKTPGYIQFEAVSDRQYLNEGPLTRGTQCTSIDALIYADKLTARKENRRCLVLIEWKYTEHYGNTDKSKEGAKKDPVNCKGEVRKRRYNALIGISEQLKSDHNGWFYYEPFYQLMRQTLWGEQMVRHKALERLKADEFVHLHVVPDANEALLRNTKPYPCSKLSMESTWNSLLKEPGKYIRLSPEKFLEPLLNSARHKELIGYLKKRYWEANAS
jgi:hypothetical protein